MSKIKLAHKRFGPFLYERSGDVCQVSFLNMPFYKQAGSARFLFGIVWRI